MKELKKPEELKPKVAILVLNWNGKQDTLECFESLKKLSYPNTEVILIDNGSSDDSVKSFQALFPEFTYIETHKNLGFAGGNNVGIQKALTTDAEFIFLLNNDTIVEPNLIEHFLEAQMTQPKAGILGAKILLYDEPDRIDHLGGFWNANRAEFESNAQNQKDHPNFSMQQVDYVCGCALFAKKQVFQTIGLLEAKFFLLWEEADFCFRAKRAGFEIWTAPKAKIWHKVSASFVGGKPHMHYFWWRSRLLWLERNHSGFQLYFRIIFPEIFKQLRHYFLLSFQFFFSSSEKKKKKLQKMMRYQAGLYGVRDYLLRRFGNCPSWLFRKKRP